MDLHVLISGVNKYWDVSNIILFSLCFIPPTPFGTFQQVSDSDSSQL